MLEITIPWRNKIAIVTDLLVRGTPSVLIQKQNESEALLQIPDSCTSWLPDVVAHIKESGLHDEDDTEKDWFRYKGVLISYDEGRLYWYRVWMEGLEEETVFDIRTLATYSQSKEDTPINIMTMIKEAIDQGLFTPDADFLEELDPWHD